MDRFQENVRKHFENLGDNTDKLNFILNILNKKFSSLKLHEKAILKKQLEKHFVIQDNLDKLKEMD